MAISRNQSQPKDIENSSAAWEILPGESAWYGRFMLFLHVDLPRSIVKAYRREWGEGGGEGPAPQRAPKEWYQSATRFHWVERALAYDTWRKEAESRVSVSIIEQKPSVDQARHVLEDASVEAAQELIRLLREGDEQRRRQAADSILNRAGVVRPAKQEPPVIPIKVIDFRGEGEK